MSTARRVAAAVAAATLTTAGLAAGLMASPAVASPATSCAPGFSDPGPVTFEESLALPRIQTGLDQGAYSAAELAEMFATINTNGDSFICLKSVSSLQGNSGKNWGAFYLARDNDHP